LRTEAESTAEKISNIVCNSRSGESPNELFDGKPSKLIPEFMVESGRIDYVKIRKKILKKWERKSIKCIMVGYADNHTADLYRMYNPETNQAALIHDIKWADWTPTDPSDTMKLFLQEEATKHATTAGIDDVEDDEVPSNPRAALISADPDEVVSKEDSHDAVTGRKDRDSGSSEARAVTRSVTRGQATKELQEATVIEAPTATEEDEDAVTQLGEAQMVFAVELNSDPVDQRL
jgi:hypothetical protein